MACGDPPPPDYVVARAPYREHVLKILNSDGSVQREMLVALDLPPKSQPMPPAPPKSDDRRPYLPGKVGGLGLFTPKRLVATAPKAPEPPPVPTVGEAPHWWGKFDGKPFDPMQGWRWR
jgi:hypothetical protein